MVESKNCYSVVDASVNVMSQVKRILGGRNLAVKTIDSVNFRSPSISLNGSLLNLWDVYPKSLFLRGGRRGRDTEMGGRRSRSECYKHLCWSQWTGSPASL